VSDTSPPDIERLIQAVLAELGSSASASTIAKRVRRLDIGLPAEDEFSVVCAWLGKCQLIHKLDQHQLPKTSWTEFQVPDLLARFSTQTNSQPLLIEVKSIKSRTLSFKPDYMQKLTNYADLLGFPLLIAWKTFASVWTLFEARHLRKAVTNFNVSSETAMKENLLGVLAGDVIYTIGANAGIHFRFLKEELVERRKNDDTTTEQWKMICDDVAFTDYKGNRRADLSGQVTNLFMTWNLQKQEEHTDTHITISFVAGPAQEIQFAHTALVNLLNWESKRNERINWRHLLRKEEIIRSIQDFAAAVDTALRQNVVHHIIHLVDRR
jgi:Holliday junction resolvase